MCCDKENVGSVHHYGPQGQIRSTNASLNKLPGRSRLVSEGSIDGTEEALYRSLLDHTVYEKDVRPCIHHSQPTNVTFGFLLNQIVEMVSFRDAKWERRSL